MRRILWFAALSMGMALAGSTACKGKDDKQESASKAATDPKATTNDTPKTGKQPSDTSAADALAQRYQDCISFARTKDYDKLATCYTADAVSTSVDFLPPVVTKGREAIIKDAKQNQEQFPDSGYDLQLLLVKDDKELVSVGLTHARQEGEDGDALKIGILGANRSVLNEQGEVTSEEVYMDQGTILSQLGASEMPARKAVDPDPAPPVVVVAEGSDTEAKNLAIVADIHDAMNAHDAAKVMELYADDIEFLYMPSPENVQGKDKLGRQLGEYFTMSKNISFTPDWAWAAGEYVVAGITTKGKNDGSLPGGMEASGENFEIHQLDVYRLRDGKVSKHWIFTNGYALAVQLDLVPDPAEGAEGK